ncbi:hypothetical protein [Streptomyces misionensis]|uniref:hypothetical protein n=1 Tax=Streptomyces misionensis TaxID=67331 RepID=UPI003685B0CB
MDEHQTARLQIYSVEERSATTAVCIVRCVEGIARAEQTFEIEFAAGQGHSQQHLRLDWILRYEKPAGFLEPPHNGKVHLTGEGIEDLTRGTIIRRVDIESDPGE